MNNILTGTTQPATTLGSNGDLYFDTVGGKIYQKEELLTWKLLGTFNFSNASAFVAGDETKWTDSASPASVQEALDQLALRVAALE